MMILLVMSGILALVFLLLGLLAWGGARLFKYRNHGRKVARFTGVAYLVFLVLFIFCLFPMIAASLIANSGTRPQDRQIQTDPSEFGRAFEAVEFPSRDGLLIKGWWLSGESDRPVFLLTHGLFRDRKEVLERGCQLNSLGYPVLLFDLRAHGESAAGVVSMGHFERLDVLAAFDYALSRGAQKVVPMGVSMGGVATLGAAAEMGPEVLAVVADSPFQSLRETIASHVELYFGLPSFPFVDFFVWNFTRINGYDGADLDTVLSVSKLGETPVLLVYGSDDKRMPRSTALSIFEAIPNSKKEVVFFENADHGDAWESDPERYLKTVVGFVEK